MVSKLVEDQLGRVASLKGSDHHIRIVSFVS